MYLKILIVAMFVFVPFLNVNTVQADEYLVISNLPAGTSSKDMRKLIESYGEINSIKCYDVQFTTGTKASCRVLMWSTKTARKVVEALNGNQFAGKELYSKEVYPVPCPSQLS